jgi:hypothetical protein
MLKKALSCVLGAEKSSTYPRGYASGFSFPAALPVEEGASLGAPGQGGCNVDLFEHPVQGH